VFQVLLCLYGVGEVVLYVVQLFDIVKVEVEDVIIICDEVEWVDLLRVFGVDL